MILTNCNCGERVECSCTLGFDVYDTPTLSILSVGNLTGGSCVFDEYVIDWYRDGVYYLTSGIGYDPDITTYHPFTGSESVVVEPGLYTPKVRYVVMGGEQIFSEPKPCHKWCLDLAVLNVQIQVDPIYCGLIGTGDNTPATNYDFYFGYRTSKDWRFATRRFIFMLDANSTMFAYSFRGYTVSDQINIYHSSDLNTPLRSWIVGTDAGTNYSSIPARYGSQYVFKEAFSLPSYSTGDYLLFEILPSVVSLNPITEWDLNLKCLDSSINFEYDLLSDSCREWDIDTLNLTYNPSTCRFEMRMNFSCDFNSINYSNTNLFKYAGLGVSSSYGTIRESYTGGTFLEYTTGLNNYGYAISNYYILKNCDDTVYLSKSGSVYTITCLSQVDYDEIKSGYDQLLLTTWYTSYVNDPTDLNYYRYHNVRWVTAPSGCGDNSTDIYYYFHISSDFVFDGGSKTVTITPAVITNQYPAPSGLCNDIMNDLNSYINQLTVTINRTDFSNTPTLCRFTYPIGYAVYHGISLPGMAAQSYTRYNFPSNYGVPLNMNSSFYLQSNTSTSGYVWFWFWFYLQLTAERNPTTGEWIGDPLENFRVYSSLNSAGEYYFNYKLIYEKINGVVTTKVYYQDL